MPHTKLGLCAPPTHWHPKSCLGPAWPRHSMELDPPVLPTRLLKQPATRQFIQNAEQGAPHFLRETTRRRRKGSSTTFAKAGGRVSHLPPPTSTIGVVTTSRPRNNTSTIDSEASPSTLVILDDAQATTVAAELAPATASAAEELGDPPEATQYRGPVEARRVARASAEGDKVVLRESRSKGPFGQAQQAVGRGPPRESRLLESGP